MKVGKTDPVQLLFNDLASLIEESKAIVARTVNSTLSLLYWQIGTRINTELVQNKRANMESKLS